MAYRDRRGATTARPVDPYPLVRLRTGAWYAVGHCHLRGEVRSFRLDRVRSAIPEGTRFTRPDGFDAVAHLRRSFALLPAAWDVEVAIDAPLAEVGRWAEPLFVDVGEDGGAAVVRCSTSDLGWLARALAAQPFPFEVRRPPELLEALERVRDAVEAAIAASRPLPNAV